MIGGGAGINITTGTGNNFIGFASGNACNSGCFNTSVGDGSLQAITSAVNNVAIGYQALQNSTANRNTAIGFSSLKNLTTGAQNVAIGYQAMLAASVADNNVCIGHNVAAGQTFTGFSNVFIGENTASNAQTCFQNVGVGRDALDLINTGSNNAALGVDALNNITSGSNNIGIGFQAGSLYVSQQNCICIGTSGFNASQADGSIIIGNTNHHKTYFPNSVFNVTTDTADAIPVIVSSEGQFGTINSSRRYKQNIRNMDHESDFLHLLQPVVYNHINHPDVLDYGLIAEDVNQIRPDLVVKVNDQIETIQYYKFLPIALNEIIKLRKEVEALKTLLK